MQTMKENFKAVNEGDSGLLQGLIVLEKSLFLIFRLSVLWTMEGLTSPQWLAQGSTLSDSIYE